MAGLRTTGEPAMKGDWTSPLSQALRFQSKSNLVTVFCVLAPAKTGRGSATGE